MHPKALLDTCAELVRRTLTFEHPADAVVSRFFREHRNLGPRERATLAETVYAVLRKKLLFEYLARSGSGPKERRLAILGFHGPRDFLYSALNMQEKSWLEACNAVDPADLLEPHRHNLPEWIAQPLKAQLGAEFWPLAQSLLQTAPLDLRVNVLKEKREQVQAELAQAAIESVVTPYSPWGLRVQGKPVLARLPAFERGLVEVQDEGSQLACLVAGAAPGAQVVDLCAGGGGKSLALAALMGNRGQIHACDTDRRRLAKLMPRAQRAGTRNIQTRFIKPHILPGGPDADFPDLEGRADSVLVDAPCSGTGAWRRSPDARWRLTPEMLESYRVTQAEVLARGARLVRPGGRLVYVTCSLLPCENEDRVAAFLGAREDFVQLPWQSGWPADLPAPDAPSVLGLRLSPASNGTDGFFVAIMQRKT
jgi:16S rRNA (cytosine967-C5)-methyltransferase